MSIRTTYDAHLLYTLDRHVSGLQESFDFVPYDALIELADTFELRMYAVGTTELEVMRRITNRLGYILISQHTRLNDEQLGCLQRTWYRLRVISQIEERDPPFEPESPEETAKHNDAMQKLGLVLNGP